MEHLISLYHDIINRKHRAVVHGVKTGHVQTGGKAPVSVQSMTNTPTLQTETTAAQVIAIAKAGGQLVRMSAQNVKEAHALAAIKSKVEQLYGNVPLVADIHFSHKAAEIAAEHVDKVRINPGNYAEKRAQFSEEVLSHEAYQASLNRTEKLLQPLLESCKRNSCALRIGANHGSLSDRIMGYYGDTPQGMVESVTEFLKICQKQDFKNIVISLKSSNTRVMIHANRLMAARMQEQGMAYPLHLGVTEAGEGEDGRIRSAVGIGALLADGIGETVRVSLSEPPEAEIPVATTLVKHFKEKPYRKLPEPLCFHPFQYKKRDTRPIANIAAADHPVLITRVTGQRLSQLAHTAHPDFYYAGRNPQQALQKIGVRQLVDAPYWENRPMTYPFFTYQVYKKAILVSEVMNAIQIEEADMEDPDFTSIMKVKSLVLVIKAGAETALNKVRQMICRIEKLQPGIPIILKASYPGIPYQEFMIKAAADTGSLFTDGMADGLMLEANNKVAEHKVTSAGFTILQAARARTTKTEYISCPSCGRTQFNLEETVAAIRARTSHLKGLKIAVMGCIVNGPGEMADADYGYVGAAQGKITLYKNKHIMKRNIPEKNAVNELIKLIKQEGDWIEQNK